MGIMLCQFFDIFGGMRQGYELKFFIFGGFLILILIKDDIDFFFDYEGMVGVKMMFGMKVLQCFDEMILVVCVMLCWLEFYKYEFCGKCILCCEGIWWVVQMLCCIEVGEGQEGDVDKLMDIVDNIGGCFFCVLVDGVVGCLCGVIGYFCDEFEVGCWGIFVWQYLFYECSLIFNDVDC